MRMIAAEAGISVGALYLYYKSKEDLCFTVFQDLFKNFISQIEERVTDLADPVDQICAYIETYMEMAKNHREFIYAFNRDKGFSFGVEWKRKFFVELRSLVDRIMRKGVESGVFTEREEGEATKVVISVLRGYVLSIVIDPDNLFSPHTCTDILLNGLVRRRGLGEEAKGLQ